MHNRRNENGSRSSKCLRIWRRSKTNPTVKDERMQAWAAGSKARILLALLTPITLQTSEPADARRVMKGFADSFKTPPRGSLFVGIRLIKLEQREEEEAARLRCSCESRESVLEAEVLSIYVLQTYKKKKHLHCFCCDRLTQTERMCVFHAEHGRDTLSSFIRCPYLLTLLHILPLSLSVACPVHHARRLLIPVAV